uniref:Meis_PKNOX_N domain-containing protein n=2 Tax=Macrostomum lignano TaxID=282301 RepID=A0A1I8G4S5_9PLAT
VHLNACSGASRTSPVRLAVSDASVVTTTITKTTAVSNYLTWPSHDYCFGLPHHRRDAGTVQQRCRAQLDNNNISNSTQVNLVSSTTNSLMQDLHNAPTLTSVELAAAHPQQESEKKCIYAHPLFPLLASVLERCEASTAQLDTQTSGKESLDADVQAFLQQHQQQQQQQQQRDSATGSDSGGGRGSLDCGSNPDLDQLMIEAVQVLGIHIIELEKVNELCRDFCS